MVGEFIGKNTSGVLPNIEGGLGSAGAGAFQTRQSNGAFRSDDSYGYYIQGKAGDGSATFSFKASWSNLIYGHGWYDGDRVVPASVGMMFVIKY
jgi:hypothetical protein